MEDTAAPATENNIVELSPHERLSRSVLWQWQRDYFEGQGITAWSKGVVPHYITSNTYIAQAYANVVFGFLRDCYSVRPDEAAFAALDLSQPIYIMELGGGSGRFAYHFLQKFRELMGRSVLKDIRFTYVLTDFAAANMEYWRNHAWLKPLVERGELDFALFDAVRDQELKLNQTGVVLAPGTLKNPLIVLANYFFDSIPQDAFYFKDGRVFETMVSVSGPPLEPDSSQPVKFSQLKLAFRARPTRADYYKDPDLDAILQTYSQQLSDTHLFFPCDAIECVRRLSHIASQRLLLLSGDKGYSKEIDLVGRMVTGLAAHGSFSLMVNYHALGQYVLNQGGYFLDTAHHHDNLNICGFLLGAHPQQYVETRLAYHESIERNSPDDFYAAMTVVEQKYADLNIEQFLAYLRLSGWDSKVFTDCFPSMITKLEDIIEPLVLEFIRELAKVWETYYPIGEPIDLAFLLATMLAQLKAYDEAIIYLQHSLELYGPHPLTYSNLGICYYELGQKEQGLVAAQQALQLDPQNEAARSIVEQANTVK